MRTAIVTSYDAPLVVEEVEALSLGPRQARIRIDASGVCHSDLTIARGGMPVPLPIILGHETAGTVLETGSAVTRVSPGDRVIVSGPQCGQCAACLQGRVRECELDPEVRATPKVRRGDGSDLVGLGGMGLWADEVPLHESQLLRVGNRINFASPSRIVASPLAAT